MLRPIFSNLFFLIVSMCSCICMYIYIYMSMYICTLCICTCISVCMDAYMYPFIDVSLGICRYVQRLISSWLKLCEPPSWMFCGVYLSNYIYIHIYNLSIISFTLFLMKDAFVSFFHGQRKFHSKALVLSEKFETCYVQNLLNTDDLESWTPFWK